jgi:hypothetical protein
MGRGVVTSIPPTGPPQNGLLELVALAVLLVLAVFAVLRRRALRRRYHLDRRQRAVRLQQQWLEPVLALVVVAGVLWKDLAAGTGHVVAAVVGAVIGVALGALRGHYMLGRARRVGRHLVLERNWQEIAVIVVLLGLQMAQREIGNDSTGIIGLITTGLLAVGVMESLARVAYITARARSAVPSAPSTNGTFGQTY